MNVNKKIVEENKEKEYQHVKEIKNLKNQLNDMEVIIRKNNKIVQEEVYSNILSRRNLFKYCCQV